MAATLIRPTDSIEVASLPVLIYGGPGVGKTSFAQTAREPLTLDFDKGAHRSFNRKDVMRYDCWADCIADQASGRFQTYKTLNLDTLGALLDCMAREIMQESGKNAQSGGLSIQGWGVLGNRFGQWVRLVVSQGQDIVMVCHEEEDKDVGGTRYLRPAMPGKMAYTVVHRLVDLMGHLSANGKQRTLSFDPTDTSIGKNAAGFEAMRFTRLEDHPDLLGRILQDAKARIGKTAEASALAAQLVEGWRARLEKDPTLEELNAMLQELGALKNGVKKQVWHLIQEYSAKAELEFDRNTRLFGRKAGA